MELFVSCYFNAFVYEITGFRIYIILLVDFFLDKQDDICSCFNVLLVEEKYWWIELIDHV